MSLSVDENAIAADRGQDPTDRREPGDGYPDRDDGCDDAG
jgi:hypothetical protein